MKAVAAASTAAVVAGGSANAFADDLHHNIAGNTINQGNTSANAPLSWRMNAMSGPPASISMNETCSTQAYWMASYFNSRGWQMRGGTFEGVAGVSPSCGNYGNWVFASGSGQTTPVSFGQYNAQSGERRGWVCVAGGINQPKFSACSTHLKPDNIAGPGSKKREQFAEYRGILDFVKAVRPVTGSGDTYLTWADIVAIPGQSTFFSSYREAGRCVFPVNELWTHHGSGGSRRVDHIFSQSSLACTQNGAADPTSGLIPNLGFLSDHRLVVGYAAAL